MFNKLNCLTYGYLPLSYGKNGFSNIGQFFRNIKYAYQRITKGYCDQDVGNLDYYYSELFYQTLNHLADNACSYPGTYELEGKTFEYWQNYLKDMAKHFKNSQEDNEDSLINVYRQEAFDKMLALKGIGSDDKYKEAQEMWCTMEKKASEYYNKEKDVGFEMMKESFFNLWD